MRRRKEWALVAAGCVLSVAAGVAESDVIHGQVNVVQNDGANNATSVTVTVGGASASFGLGTSNRGDFNLAAGTMPYTGGVLISSPRQNGRNNDAAGGGQGGVDGTPFGGIRYATTAVDRTGTGWFVPTFDSSNSANAGGDEFNVNFAAAYFSYDQYLGGHLVNSTSTNGGANNLLASATTGLVLGTHVVDNSAGQTTIAFQTLSAQTTSGTVAATSQNGILLVVGGKNEDNFALARANVDGSFTVFCHDNGVDGASYEQDHIAFVYMAANDPNALALGRIDNEGDTIVGSGSFTVTHPSTGQWLLKIAGQDDTTGTLIVSAEGGTTNNVDNIVSYEWDTAQQGWIIQARDLPNVGLQNGAANEPIFSFAFFPVPEPTTAGLIIPGLAMLAARRRRK